MREHSPQPSRTPHGERRVVRYRASNGWYLDVDAKWPMPDRDVKRYGVYYGPGVLHSFATREEAFAHVRSIVENEKRMGWTPCPYRRNA